MGKLRQTAEHTDWAMYSQINEVTSLEITPRPQLYFSSRLRKAAKPVGRCQDQLQWLMTPCPGTDQSVETTTLEEHTWKTDECSAEIIPWDLLRFLPAKERKTLKTKDPPTISPSGEQAAQAFPFPLFFPHRHSSPKLWGSPKGLQPGEQCAAEACPGLTSWTCLHGPFSLTSQGAKAASPWLPPVASSLLSSFLFHCLRL